MTFPSDSAELLRRFDGIPTSAASDCLGRLAGTCALTPLHGGAALRGVAFTVRVRAGDNLYIHEALRRVTPGSVVVVDGGGCIERALIGEIIMTVAQARGVTGFVIDGAVRDVAAFRAAGMPCYARGVTHRGPYKDGPGDVAQPVVIDGQIVHPGDLVLGDEDGVLFVRPQHAQALAAAARAKLAQEAATLAAIADGRYDESWIDTALAASVPLRP